MPEFFNLDTNAQIKIKAVGDIMLGSVTPKEILPSENGNEFVQETPSPSRYRPDGGSGLLGRTVVATSGFRTSE